MMTLLKSNGNKWPKWISVGIAVLVILMSAGSTFAVFGWRISRLEDFRGKQEIVNQGVIKMKNDIEWIRRQMEQKELEARRN